MITFIVIGAIGLVVLVLSVVIDGLLDVDGGALSIPGVAGALTVFGASGAIVTALGWPTALAYVVAAALGVGAYFAAAGMIGGLQRSSDGEARDTTGDTGTATSDITTSTGEVALDHAAEVERRMAFADLPIPQGTRIRVISHLGARVKVEPLSPIDAPYDSPYPGSPPPYGTA